MIYSKYFKNWIPGIYFNLKKYNIPLELASVRPFFHTNTYHFLNLCHLKAMLKAMYSKTSMEAPYFYVLFLCLLAIMSEKDSGSPILHICIYIYYRFIRSNNARLCRFEFKQFYCTVLVYYWFSHSPEFIASKRDVGLIFCSDGTK